MIICRLTDYDCELKYNTLEDAIKKLEELEESCCDDEDLAETYNMLQCDVREELEDAYSCAYTDENDNLVFER